MFCMYLGSASIHLHMLSPTSQPLFQRTILMSGTAKNTWAICDMNEHVLSMFALGKFLSYYTYIYEFKNRKFNIKIYFS